jgi:hypothetical protein
MTRHLRATVFGVGEIADSCHPNVSFTPQRPDATPVLDIVGRQQHSLCNAAGHRLLSLPRICSMRSWRGNSVR